jgi:peptidylprolyl isomerase
MERVRRSAGLITLLGSVIASGCMAAASPEGTAPPASNAPFVKLYNGKDLSGWGVHNGKMDAWKANGDMLSCIAPGGGWLRTDKPYSDFVLRLEYRIPKEGNSGVGLRFPPVGDPAHEGMEIQILDDNAPVYQKMNLVPAQHTGGIYYQAPAKQGVAKPPGEWNSYEITCLGPHVKVVLNGQVVNDVMVDEFKKGAGGHKALAERPQVGYVGLQSHASGAEGGKYEPIDFRNIEIKDLTTALPSGLHYVDLAEGTGPVVPPGATIEAHYTGTLADGTKFDSSRDRGTPITFPLAKVIPGWREGIPGMKVGGRRKLIIPPELGYGARGAGGVIPPNALLVFDVEVLKVVSN